MYTIRITKRLRIDKARCLIGNPVKKILHKKNIILSPAPANFNRAIGLIEQLISTIKQRLARTSK